MCTSPFVVVRPRFAATTRVCYCCLVVPSRGHCPVGRPHRLLATVAFHRAGLSCGVAVVLLAIIRVGVPCWRRRRVRALCNPAPLLGPVQWHYLCRVRAVGLAVRGAKLTSRQSLSGCHGTRLAAQFTYSSSHCLPWLSCSAAISPPLPCRSCAVVALARCA